MESAEEKKKRARKIVETLATAYPEARGRLTHASAFELLIKTILSAQCTDERVNRVGETLFRKYRTPQDFIDVAPAELEADIRPTGFFRMKAKHLRACCRMLIERHHGEVPSRRDELTALPGVGRKTAGVLLGNVFGIPALAVDTHVIRIGRLLKWTRHRDADRIEKDLMNLLPPETWVMLSHRLQAHGRTVCIAHRPSCPKCVIRRWCPSAKTIA